MNTVSVCHIHDRFVDEWRRAYPTVPAPVPQCVRDISSHEGDRSQHGSDSVSAVRRSLDSVNQRIARLSEELGKETLVKQLLTQVLHALGETAEEDKDYEGAVDLRPRAGTRRTKNDHTGREPGLVSGQTDNTRVVKGGAVLFSSGYTGCDCVHSLAESCSLCAVRRIPGAGEDVFDRLSPESLKFVSKIEISGDDGSRASRQGEQPNPPPHYRNSWTATAQHHGAEEEGAATPAGKGVDSVISRSNSVPDQDMFRKPKVGVIGGPGHDDEAGRHRKVGSKDNFLAIRAKNVYANEGARNPQASSGSPKMNRHYQMLKLTPGHEFVLESDADNGKGGVGGVDDKATKTAQVIIGEPIRHGSAVGNNDRCDVHATAVAAEVVKNSHRAESPNFKTSPSRAGVSIISVENTKKKTTDEPRGDSLALSDPTTVASLDNNSTRSDTETRHSTNGSDTIQSSRQQSIKKSPVPPPVAKKPVKLTSSNQLSPGVTGHIAFPTTTGELSPDVHPPPPLPARGSLERKGFPEFSENKTTCVSENVHGCRDNGEDRNSAEPIKVLPPSPLVAEFKTKYVDRQNSWPNELQEERARREVTTCGVLDNLAVYREGKPSEFLSRPKSEEILGMISFKPADDGRQKAKFGVGGLVENMKTNFGLARAKFQDSENLSEQGGDSFKLAPKRSSTPPVPPPRSQQQAEKPEAAPFVIGGGATGDHAGSFRRMSSSASTDTITEFNRKTSFSWDFDVKEALSTLDTLLTSHSSEDMELPEGPDARVEAGRQKFRFPSYENWTIDRTLTSSISPMYVDSLSDDDELDGGSSISPAAASPSIRRHGSPTGSKDSGLCDETTADQGDSVFDGDLPPGRMLSVIKKLEEREEEASDQCDSLDEPPMKFVDYGEVVDSGFVYSTSRDTEASSGPDEPGRVPSPSPDYGPEDNSAQPREVDRGSWVTDSSGEEDMVIALDTSHDELDSATEGILKMRQLLVKGVLDSEKEYLDMLKVLIQYKHSLAASSQTSVPVISKEDVATIFSNIETIYDIHEEFVQSLMPKVQKWNHQEVIGEIFKIMIFKFITCGSYLSNYHLAVRTVRKCCSESEQFEKLAKEIKISTTLKQTTTLEDALFKPVQRVQRNTLVLHDLIKYTPEDHPDMFFLQNALKLSQELLEKIATEIPKHGATKENRRLVKSSFLVELVNGTRKLRFMFLFSDILICTKRVTHRNNKVTFDIKWFTPLNQMTYDTKFGYNDDLKNSIKDDIEDLKIKIRTLKKELKLEMKKYDSKEKHRSSGLSGVNRTVEKLKKKINQQEAMLILACPKLPFKVSLEGGKTYTLLMTTDYEREEWKETLAALVTRTEQQQINMNSIFVQELINSVKETPQVNKIGNVLMQTDEDILTGTLNVTIHKLDGLTDICDTYCCLEMDSFGHFFMKAKTHIAQATRDPTWHEDFELELEGSQTIRFLCFRKEQGDSGDKLLGRGALELSQHWLKGSFQERTVVMNEISLVISVRHTAAEKTMSRTPSRTSSAVFGVKISTCAKREGKTVPSLVTACLQEVEKRGLDEVGIYRVSGVTSDLQRIKKLFDKNVRIGSAALEDVDIHAVTGILKLYLRELPEPLFTEANYQRFVDTLKLSDEEAKAQCMLSLLHSLPDINYYTIVSLLEHLLKVARNVNINKMSVHNLATVFGPTLLAPAAKQDTNDPMELMFKGAEEVMHQSSVVNYLLGLAVSGRSLRKSAQ